MTEASEKYEINSTHPTFELGHLYEKHNNDI